MLVDAPYDGAGTVEARLGRLVRVTGAFLDQAARWYRSGSASRC